MLRNRWVIARPKTHSASYVDGLGDRQQETYQPEALARAGSIPRLRFGLVCYLLPLALGEPGNPLRHRFVAAGVELADRHAAQFSDFVRAKRLAVDDILR